MKKQLNRRDFLRTTAGGIGALALPGCAEGQFSSVRRPAQPPNILWISCEDISPDLGCYGDTYAVSPHIDKLATEGVRYDNAFTPAGVCAPVRSSTITGMYQSSIGTCPMRCKGAPPEEVKCFPEYLRAAGYYCTNRSKTDYQFNAPFSAWDDSSRKGHWRNRPKGKPFFSVINLTVTHESQIRSPKGKKAQLHDPAQAKVPPYYPDTPLVRNDLACYADNITKMDQQAAEVLKQLEDDGLAEDTIVWFWGDHGRGLPRCKRWIYDSGMRVPLIVRVPEKYRAWVSPGKPGALKPGTVNGELVSFVDFAPTMLSLAGIPIPKHLQGQAFLGPQKPKTPRQYIYGARDRIDEAPDLVRAVNDGRYSYIRNFMWHLTYALDVNYMNQMPTMQEMRRLNAAGKLKGAETLYFLPTRPADELYDLKNDPHEVNNLAGNPKYKEVLRRMRQELSRWMREIGDVGLIPEPDFDAMKRPGDRYEVTADPMLIPVKQGESELVKAVCFTPGASIGYQIKEKGKGEPWLLYTQPVRLKAGQELTVKANRIGFKDSQAVRYPFGGKTPVPSKPPAAKQHWRDQLKGMDLLARLLEVKDLDFEGVQAVPRYTELLKDRYGPVRYWAVIGLHNLCREKNAIDKARKSLGPLLQDESWSVRIAAAHALCDWGEEQKGLAALEEALKNANGSGRHFAMVALERIGEKARPALASIRARLKDGYAGRVAQRIVAKLKG